MSDPIDGAIQAVLEQIKNWEIEIAPTMARINEAKATVNGLCRVRGREPMFTEVTGLAAGQPPAPAVGTVGAPQVNAAIKVDQFTGMGLATAASAVLELRAKHAGTTSPASVDQIHEALLAGGFIFPSKDIENQKRGLAVSLAKNSYTFRRIGNGMFGLVNWYGAPQRKPRKTSQTAPFNSLPELAAGAGPQSEEEETE